MNSESARIPVAALKGRGASVRMQHRFETEAREAFDDGWGLETAADGEALPMPPAPQTEVRWEDARSALVFNRSPDLAFDRSINPYRGCEHGCAYCYARPSHSYLGLSPGLDFETRIIAKRGLADQLRAELAAPRYTPGPLGLGVNTDAYQPLERELGVTRSVLEVLQEARHAFALITKGSGVERDLDIIAPMAQQGLAAVYVTITTLDPHLARILEPRAPAPWRRLETIRRLSAAGVPVGVSVSPQIPFINEDMEQVLQAAWQAGARRAFYVVMRLPWELRELFTLWLQQHFPQRAERVLARITELQGGKLYDSRFGQRMKGQGAWADLLGQRFHKTLQRLGYRSESFALDHSAFRRPGAHGQGALF